jgi:rhamnogalacturonan acetylesterase
VVIEFRHNDGVSPNSASDNGRSERPGTGNEVCTSGKDDSKVYTFNKYVGNAARAYIAKGAKVIISSKTPNDQWEGGVYGDGAPRFLEYAQLAAQQLGNGRIMLITLRRCRRCIGSWEMRRQMRFMPRITRIRA